MKKRLITSLLLGLSCMTFGQKKSETKEWEQLFNGKNLDGWDIKIRHYDLNDNFANTFRVKDGKLVVSYDGYDKFDEKFGHIFYKKKFSNYIIATEYRFVGEQAPEDQDGPIVTAVSCFTVSQLHRWVKTKISPFRLKYNC
jgi:hypothetical protein